MQMRSAVTVFLAITAMVVFAGSAGAMPHLARNLSMECGECHLTVPKLSLTGLEFKADGFAFDDITPVKGKIDFSAQIQARYKNETHHDDDFDFTMVKILGADSLNDRGGYYQVEWLPYWNRGGGSKHVSAGGTNGVFKDFYISKAASMKRRFRYNLGQFRAGSQVDMSQRLSISTPLAFRERVGKFSYAGRSPSIGFSYYDGKPGESSINGWTHNVVVPFEGRIAFSDQFELRTRPKGVFLESFRRKGYKSYGCYSFIGEGQTLIGGVAEHNCGPKSFQTLNLGWSTDDDALRLSFSEDYLISQKLSVGARYDHYGGVKDYDAGIAYMSLNLPKVADWMARLQAEYRYTSDDRLFTVQSVVDF